MFNKPKKLKKIPYDVVSYVLIEAEAIKDANDKQMISSYCLGKLEQVNWYLELIETGSKKYIVPQSKAQLSKSGISFWPLIRQSWRQRYLTPRQGQLLISNIQTGLRADDGARGRL